MAFDVKAGLVTKKGAKRYGVVLKKDLTVDEKKTTELREKMAKERGEPPIFDFGFESIDELKARCKKEMGHPAPRQPEFQTWVTAGRR